MRRTSRLYCTLCLAVPGCAVLSELQRGLRGESRAMRLDEQRRRFNYSILKCKIILCHYGARVTPLLVTQPPSKGSPCSIRRPISRLSNKKAKRVYGYRTLLV